LRVVTILAGVLLGGLGAGASDEDSVEWVSAESSWDSMREAEKRQDASLLRITPTEPHAPWYDSLLVVRS